MATYRGQGETSYAVGSAPPEITWTVVKGDTASFRVYVTDDNKEPLIINDWTIEIDFKRPDIANNYDQNSAGIVFSLTPSQGDNDGDGEFTVSITANQSSQLKTGDVFDIELHDVTRVWTVARGKMIILEDVTN